MKYFNKVKLLALNLPVFIAQGSQQIKLQPGQGLAGDLENLTIPGLVSALIQGALVVAAIVFFFILVIGGITWIMSGGDKAKTEESRARITSALIGLTIVFAAWAIAELINVFFHVDIFELDIPSAQ